MIRIHLSRLLGEQRITQAELARMTNIRPSTINDWYHEMLDRINLAHLDRICEALGCTATELVEYTPNPTPQTTALQAVRNQR